jgi:hypothetical protein
MFWCHLSQETAEILHYSVTSHVSRSIRNFWKSKVQLLSAFWSATLLTHRGFTMDFEIIKIARDDATVRSYVERYKAFRLLSLQTAPAMFGSTYEREIAFSEDTWLGRLSSPTATTFLAIQENRTIGMITTVGPLPFLPEE